MTPTEETIGVTVTYKEPITFHLRMIGIDDENKLRQKMFGLTEEEKAEKSYQNNVDLLATLSELLPSGLFPNKPKVISDDDTTVYAEDFDTPSEAVREFFAGRTVLKERLAEYAVRGYFVRLQPDVNFS